MTPKEMARTHALAFSETRAWTETEFADLLAGEFVHAIGSVDCFAVFQVIGDEAELLTIATDPAQRRRGLARACMNNWQTEAFRRGARRGLLDVAADNSAAIALYAGCGYVPCGLRKAYYQRADGKKVNAILMERPLP
ncbi:GNAT family N-acetyltransferase [Ruegeria marina]|uniref:Ribosomal-protein-alanine N-acetyltransferase n=1 Tax=Ruegeria marina TaxID=639004 RepID=A0A1G6M5Z5_9RHOB|nr:GNAT family N-acetyltransferase [Ruegeria marina]SDC50893.1 ribosomal-protein-alanine N-acetyltransferase [Ruegeria marina]